MNLRNLESLATLYLIATAACLLASHAAADEALKIVEIHCDRKANEFSVSAFTDKERPGPWEKLTQSRPISKGQSRFFLGDGMIQEKCQIAPFPVAVEIEYPNVGAFLDCKRYGLLRIRQGTQLQLSEVIHNCMGDAVFMFRYSRLHGWVKCNGTPSNHECKVL